MKYKRKYLQFNDLVFDNYDMLSEYEYGQVSTKYNETPISYAHGSYVPNKKHSKFEAYSVSLTLNSELKKIPCEYRKFYRSFIVEETSKAGKLWAIQNNELVWAYAICTSYTEDTDIIENDIIISDLDFFIYEGIWHKADKQKTFIIPFDICRFLDCLNYKEIQPCKFDIGQTCFDACATETEFCEVCECDKIEKENALCYNLGKLQEFYAQCTPSYKIIYDYESGVKFFTDDVNKKLGQRFCNNCNQLNASVYVDTDLPTNNYEFVLHGQMHNPFVEINGKAIEVLGDYDGYLTFFGNGDVYFSTNDLCCGDWIPTSEIIIKPYKDEETGNEIFYNEDLGFTFHPRYNNITVDMGICCDGLVNCMYINVDSITK